MTNESTSRGRGRPPKSEAEKAETKRLANKRRSESRRRKREAERAAGEVKSPREATIVTTLKKGEVACPRCGETTSIQLAHAYYKGKKRYACWSETCKNHGPAIGRPRFFVVMPDGEWAGAKKS